MMNSTGTFPMHLSLLSDGYFSDAIDDAGQMAASSAGRAHRDGLFRGLAFMAIAGALIGLTMLSCPLHSAAATTPCRIGTGSTANDAQAAVWWEAATPFPSNEVRPFHAYAPSGTAVSLVALRKKFRSSCR